MRHILPCLGMVLLFVVVAIPLVWLHDSPAQFTTPSAGGGTSDSLGIDTDGDGVIDNYLYSTAGAVAVIKKGANITLTVEGDSVTVAGPTGAGTADSVAVDTTGDGAIDAYLYSSAGAIALLRKGERMIFNVAIDTLYLNAENVAVSDSNAASSDSTDQITHGNIKDWHIDFGTGTGQVSSDDVTEGSSNLYDKDLADSSNWSTAYAWGNHAAQNYLDDDVEDDVDDADIAWGSGAGQVDTDDIPEGSSNKYDQPLPDSGNWSTAYSWGDHSGENYLDDDVADDVDDGDIDWGSGVGQVNLDDFDHQTAWRLFYSNVDGDVTELALGNEGEYLKSAGSSSVPTWETPAGGASDSIAIDTTGNADWGFIYPSYLRKGSNVTLSIQEDTLTISGPAGAGTADSLAVDTDGDGEIDNYLYSTAGPIAMIKQGTNITLTVNTDTLTIAGPAASGTADSIAVDTTGDGAIDAYLYSTAGAIAMLRQGNNMIFSVNIDTLYLNVNSDPWDSLTAWGNLVNDNRDSATTHSPLVNEAKDSLTAWANLVNSNRDSATTHSPLVNEAKDSLTAWGNLINDNRDSATTHSALVNENKDSLTSWGNLVNDNRDSATTHSPLVNEAKDSLTSWANKLNTAYDWGDHSAEIGETLWTHLDDTSAVLWTGLTDTTWDMKNGFVWSGAHEFTGGTPSLEIPNADAPTTNAEGEIAWDANDDAIEVFSGDESESVLLPIYYDIEAMVFAPDGVNDYIPIFHVDALLYPHGIEIDQLSITLPTSTDYTLPVHEVGSDHAFDARIDSLVVSSAQYLEDDSPMDGNLDADDYIYLNVPSTDVDWIFVKIIYHVTEGN